MARLGELAFAFVLTIATSAVPADETRARVDYMIHCQGCHLPEAAGVPGHVPRMKNFLGYFLHSQAGREFIVQVPGAATSNLSDARLAELVNWLLLTYSRKQLPEDFEPYKVDEITRLRPHLQADPESARQEILRGIAESLPVLAAELETMSGY